MSKRMIYGAFNLIEFFFFFSIQKQCASVLRAIGLKQTNVSLLLAAGIGRFVAKIKPTLGALKDRASAS